MNNSGKTTRSAPCRAASARARSTLAALPATSPTMALSCATAIGSRSAGVFMRQDYLMRPAGGNPGACRSECVEAIAALHEDAVEVRLEVERLRNGVRKRRLEMCRALALDMPVAPAAPSEIASVRAALRADSPIPCRLPAWALSGRSR